MDDRTIEEIRENETKLINEIKTLEKQVKKQQKVINNIAKCFNDGDFEDGCDCLIIEKYINSYLKKVSK